MTPTGALLVVGATSGAGKSTLVAGLCRSWRRRGSSVAPFKAQNMSNHSAVTVDGGEVGRSQAFQALAAGVDVETAMNPVLLKPADDRSSHVVVRGVQVARTDAVGWQEHASSLRQIVLDELVGLRRRFDVVVAEGAGGAAEINLLDRDIVNVPLAAAAGVPAIVVVDIERGGAFAAALGTIELLPERLRRRISGVVFNRFRGDPSLLDTGVAELESRTGVPVLGVLSHLGPGPLLAVEDSLDVDAVPARSGSDRRGTADPLRVAVVALPRLANPSDVDPLATEPDVALRWVASPGEVADADVVVIPGSRSTVADLAWLRRRGLDAAIVDAAARGTHVVGLCAGAQMLGTTIEDGVESDVARVDGIGLLPLTTRFDADKVVRRRTGVADGHDVRGYQIHQGRVSSNEPWLRLRAGDGWEVDGSIGHDGRVLATTLHGLFDADDFRRTWLTEVARDRGRSVLPAEVGFEEALGLQAERLADWVEADLDVGDLDEILGRAAPVGREPGW